MVIPSSRGFVRSAFVLFVLVILATNRAVPTPAGVIRQLTDHKPTSFPLNGGPGLGYPPLVAAAAIDDAGTAVYVNASTNQLGGNPSHRFQIFRFDAATGAGQQVTNFPEGVSNRSGTVSVSDDGQWLAFVSRANPVGQNHDASSEVFVMKPDGSGIAQVTSDPAVNAGSVRAAQMSGSANRIAFLSNSNPLGTNPLGGIQLFVVNFDGTGIRQLTTLGTPSPMWSGISISDDGQRLVFATTANLTGGNPDGSKEVFAIQADGTGLRQLTSAAGRDSELPVISGNGGKIAFQSTGNFTSHNADGTLEVFVVNWDGTGMTQLSSPATSGRDSYTPSITDDGQFVFYSSNQLVYSTHDIVKIKTDGTGLTQLTSAVAPHAFDQPVVAGGGNRVVFVGSEGGVRGFPERDTVDLDVMTGSGTNSLQLLLSERMPESEDPAITRDGTRVVFYSTFDPFGTNTDGSREIFRVESDGSGLAQVTNFSNADCYSPSIAADRTTIVFEANANPVGQNVDGSEEIFLIHADGTGIRQLTASAAGADAGGPMISANGAVVVFRTVFNGTYTEIMKVNADGTGLVQLTNGMSTSYDQRIDDTATWITFKSLANLDGTAPNGVFQIWRVRSDGTNLRRVSTDNTRHDWFPDISGSGDRIVYLSSADPLGSNSAHRYEEFLYDAATSTTRQLTFSPAPIGSAYAPSISGDGNFVYFSATAPYDEGDPDLPYNLYRVPAVSGHIERIGALAPSELYYGDRPRSDMTGSKFVFDGIDDTSEQNGDRSSEIWIGDMAKTPEIRVSKAAPTLLSWDYEAGPIRYDVIRGDVDNLAPGPPGTVDLGPVACLENDSPDSNTLGFEDPAQPPVGHAFFFLYRGSGGLNLGPGTWGQSSSGTERTPGSGVCAP